MTLVNESAIPACLVLDLRGEDETPDAQKGVECLSITPLDKSATEEGGGFKPVPLDFFEDHSDSRKPDDLHGEGQQEGGESAQRESRTFNITIKPQQTMRFKLTFNPRVVGNYSFNLPLTVLRYGKHPSITRRVMCQGLKPKFLLDPQVVEFERKIITSVEHQFPTNSEVN